MYPHHVFDLEPVGTFGMYPICYWRISGRYFQPEPAMYLRCFCWFPGPLAPSGNDTFPNLFFDDRLWAHMIYGAEWLCMVDRKKINDPSLLSLLCMGVLNWKAPNDHLHQATQVIRHGTTIALHFLPRIMKIGRAHV